MMYIKSKVQALILILAILCTQNLMGQRGRHHQPNMMEEVEALKEDLNLSKAQTAQIEKLEVDFKAQVEAVKSDDSKEHWEKRAAMKILMKNQKAAVGEVLNTVQKKLLEERKTEYKAERKAKMDIHASNRKELKTALKAYRAENIEPVILTQRAKLEKILSAEDKAELAELRVAFAAKKVVAKKDGIRKHRGAHKTNGEKRNPADRAIKMEARKSRKEAMENDEDVKVLKVLVAKYESNIEELYAEIESEKTEWKAAQKKIAEQFKQEIGIEGKGHSKGHVMKGKKRRGEEGRRRHHEGHEGKIKKGHFLLMDPNQVTENSSAIALTQIKVYPNPATSSNTLDYVVKEAGRIKIELHDVQGRLVNVLLDEEKVAGNYQLNTDLSTLKNRTYFYVVSDKQGVTTKKFLILEK